MYDVRRACQKKRVKSLRTWTDLPQVLDDSECTALDRDASESKRLCWVGVSPCASLLS